MADRFASQGYSLNKQTRWSNDKTIVELVYRKISWFVSHSQNNYLQKPKQIIDLLATTKETFVWLINLICDFIGQSAKSDSKSGKEREGERGLGGVG